MKGTHPRCIQKPMGTCLAASLALSAAAARPGLAAGYRRCVCTAVISLAPAARMPLLLMGFRDEFTGRPWQPPARHWPGSPLIGGRDEQAGGTWLAVHPAVPRVSCILNARGRQAALSRRRSRGELPLRVAAEGQTALRELHANPGDLAVAECLRDALLPHEVRGNDHHQ